jgi:hypothetical protein
MLEMFPNKNCRRRAMHMSASSGFEGRHLRRNAHDDAPGNCGCGWQIRSAKNSERIKEAFGSLVI